MRPLLHGGQVVRADHPDPAAYLHGVVAADRAEALFAYVQLTASAFETPGLARLPGLDRDRAYRVSRWRSPASPRPSRRQRPGWRPARSPWAAGLAEVGLRPCPCSGPSRPAAPCGRMGGGHRDQGRPDEPGPPTTGSASAPEPSPRGPGRPRTPRRSTCRGPGGSGCRPGPTPTTASPTPDSTTPAGRPCRCRRTGSSTATAPPPTPTSSTRSRSTRRTSHRQPDRRLPGRVPAARGWAAERTVLRFEGPASAFRVWLNGRELGGVDREPAAGRVRRHRGPGAARRRQPAGGAGAAVVGRQLPGGPGHGGCPGSSARSGCWPARPGRSTTGSSTPATTTRPGPAPCGSRPASRPAHRARAGGGRGRGRHRSAPAVEPWSAESPRLYDGLASARRAGDAADRLPHRRRPRRAAHRQRPPVLFRGSTATSSIPTWAGPRRGRPCWPTCC